MDEVVIAEGLTKYYDGRIGVEDVNFTVRRGEIFGYLGPNGAGKTTTIRLMLGFLRPTRGRITVLGVDSRDDARLAMVKNRIGFLPEEFTFPRGLKAREIIRYYSRIRGEASRLDELLDLFPLNLDKRVEEYSKGMKQMLALILAFMHDPDFLVLDEPTSGLDPLMRDKLLNLLRREANRGKTVFLSSHVLSEVQRVADRVCLIKNGRIVALEDLQSLLSKSGKIIRAKVRKPLDLKEIESLDGVVKARILNDNREVEVIARSNYSAILSVISSHDLEDVEVRNMTLEELFMHFYER